MQQQLTAVVTPAEPRIVRLLDVAVEVSGRGMSTAVALGRRVGWAGGPALRLLPRPPLLLRPRHEATWWDDLSSGGAARRAEAARRVSAALDVAVPVLVAHVLRRVDPADLIHTYVDVDRVVAEVDLDAVLSRIDLVALVKEVVDELDLPEMVRESTSAMASDSVRGLRMHSISADDAIGRAVARVRVRRAVPGGVTPVPDRPPGPAETTAP